MMQDEEEYDPLAAMQEEQVEEGQQTGGQEIEY